MEDRSRERLLCADLVEVEWLTDRGQSCRESAVLEDYSRAGGALSIAVGIAPGTAITIHAGQESFGACIRYCLWRDNGYVAGVEFDHPWRGGTSFTPAHLFDPKLLGI
ncbi:MAG TPA: hypothetical protein VHA14_11230 [Bryobacteraceae bacterium]|nr:hypothetical protein [Bryobacteraceae bacterium]